MAAYVLLRVIAVILLVATNAFFVAAEFALVSVRDTRVEQLIEAGRSGARTVLKLHQKMDELLSAVQLGVTLASLGLGWIGEPTLAVLFQRIVPGSAEHPSLWAHGLAVTFAFALITYFHVVLGEVVPKGVALQRADRVALAVAGPMDIFMTLSLPFLRVIGGSARRVLQLFGAREIRAGSVHSPEELKLAVTASRRTGMLDKYEEDLVLRSLELRDLTVRQVMVPRPGIFSLPADMALDQALTRVVEEQHSRVPVYEPQRGPEHIIGLLYSKDLTRWMRARYSLPQGSPATANLQRLQIRDIMRDVLVVPETKELPELLVEFKNRKRHLAVVVDEFGSTAGVVTVEDVLEQLVGEIEDEFDVTAQPIATAGGVMLLDGSTNIRDLDTQSNMELPADGGFETLGGFVLAQLQRIPEPGASFEFQGRRFTVVGMEGRRIAKVQVEPVGSKTVSKAGD